MLKTYLYIPDDIAKRIDHAVRTQKKSKAEVIRQALDKGLAAGKSRSSAQSLLALSRFAKENKIKGPRDASINHDYYLWGLPKRNPRMKP
jgi:metal-responsive CopG/Arc/MetJ family transcriptional regulator